MLRILAVLLTVAAMALTLTDVAHNWFSVGPSVVAGIVCGVAAAGAWAFSDD